MKTASEKSILCVAIVFSGSVAVPALFWVPSGAYPTSDLLIKLLLIVYCFLVFCQRIWAAMTILLGAAMASLQTYFIVRELMSNPEFWWNKIMYGNARSVPYYGHDNIEGLKGRVLLVAISGVVAAYGFWAYRKLKAVPHPAADCNTPSVAAIDPKVEAWRNYIIALDHENRLVELKRLEETNPAFHEQVARALLHLTR